jgi:hypothetical protein
LRSLIDAGAVLNGQHPQDVARDIMAFASDHVSAVEHVLYFNPDTQSYFVLTKGRDTPTEIRTMNRANLAAVVGNFDKLFVYYDEPRCTGTDFPLMINCNSLQTVDPSWLTRDRNAQANLRPRGFLSTQKIDYVALERSREHFLQLTGNGEPTVADFFATLERNQERNVAMQHIQSCYDKVRTLADDFIQRTRLKLSKSGDEAICYEFERAIADMTITVDDFSPEAMFLNLRRTCSLKVLVEEYYKNTLQMLESRLASPSLKMLISEEEKSIFEEGKERILASTGDICLTVGSNGRTDDSGATVQVETQTQQQTQQQCDITIEQQLEAFLSSIKTGERPDPIKEKPLTVCNPTNMHAFFSDKSRSVSEQILHHGGSIDPNYREMYAKFTTCFSDEFFLSFNFAQSCETEHTIFDRTQKHCSYLMFTWSGDGEERRMIAISKQEFDTLSKAKEHLQNCCIVHAGTGEELVGGMPRRLNGFYRKMLCEHYLFDGNVLKLLQEDSDLVAKTMAADGEGNHSLEVLALRQNYLYARSANWERDKNLISQSRTLGRGHGKTWPERELPPSADDIFEPPVTPVQESQLVSPRIVTHKNWAIALTVVAVALLIIAAALLIFSNVIVILAIGVLAYVLLFSPGLITAIIAAVLWWPIFASRTQK